MTKAGKMLIAGAKEALAYAEGHPVKGTVAHVPKTVDVKAIRQKLKVTQAQFAEQFGFDVSAVRDWEQDRRQPERTARILLKVIEEEPKVVRKVLAKA